jgi:hypothetical protein
MWRGMRMSAVYRVEVRCRLQEMEWGWMREHWNSREKKWLSG